MKKVKNIQWDNVRRCVKKKITNATFCTALAQRAVWFSLNSDRTILKTSRLTRACHCPFNALSLQGAPLKDAPNLHSPSHCPGTETDWESSVVRRLLHFEHCHKSIPRGGYLSLTLIVTSNSIGQVGSV